VAYNPNNKVHQDVLLTLKNNLANYIDVKTMKCVATNIKENYQLFERDIIEVLGFQNGNHPELDLKNYGMLSLMVFLRFVEDIK